MTGARRPQPPGATPRLRAVGLSRRFGGTQAVADAHLAVAPGSIHGLVGQNGAGKSTLVKMLAGLVRSGSGHVEVDGEPHVFHRRAQARAAGIALVAQELTLVPTLSVAENVLLGALPKRFGLVSRARMLERFEELNRAAGFDLPASELAGRLPLAMQQKAEIQRTLAQNHRVIILDEPTSSLSQAESEKLYSLVRWLAGRGVTVILVSHFLEEVLAVCDTVTVMRDGHVVRTGPTEGETPSRLVRDMVGQAVDLSRPARPRLAAGRASALSVRGFTRRGAFSDIDLDVREGEIVALVGLVGAGRTELLRAIYGLDPRDSGELRLAGRHVRLRSPRQAARHGLMLIPESRKDEGLVLVRSAVENITAGHSRRFSRRGLISQRDEKGAAATAAARARVQARSLDLPVNALSGGNQQKTLFARVLVAPPRVLLVDEPTRGVDVLSIPHIQERIAEHAAGGGSVLLATSEFEHALATAHRILVMRGGRIVGEHAANDTTTGELLHEAFGATDDVEVAG